MRLLVWQWGTRGAGPRYASELTDALRLVPGVQPVLSLAQGAEILTAGEARCDLPVATYRSATGWAGRMASIPLAAPALARRLRRQRLDAALCAMPAPLDLLMAVALQRLGVPYAVAVHDAALHPGDILPLQAALQRLLLKRAAATVALSGHVAQQLGPVARGRPVLRARLSPLRYGTVQRAPMQGGGPLRLLSFGRLLPYKGLDLLAAALACLPPGQAEVRVVGTGPESAELAALRALPGVTVENRWVPEAEVGGLAEQLAGYSGARLCAANAEALAEAIRSLWLHPPSVPPFDAGDAWRDSVADLAGRLAAALTPRPGHPLASRQPPPLSSS